MKTLAIVSDARFKLHDTGSAHPESPARLDAVADGLEQSGVIASAMRIDPQPVDMKWVRCVHDQVYIERFREACRRGAPLIDVMDCPICERSYEIAALAAGAVAQAASDVVSGKVRRAFCAVRPPGHHAERHGALGFCMFNNVAIAAEVARRKHNCRRILILDWDVHHGNGTQHSFERDPGVMFISLHGHPDYLYPGSGYAHEVGFDDGRGHTLNIPLMPRTADDAYLSEFMATVVPAIRNYEPELIILSAGFDAHADDPVGNLSISDETYVRMLERVLELADRHSEGRVLSVLEGGYNPDVLRRCVADHVRLLNQ